MNRPPTLSLSLENKMSITYHMGLVQDLEGISDIIAFTKFASTLEQILQIDFSPYGFIFVVTSI
jgi:hypothetical protein